MACGICGREGARIRRIARIYDKNQRFHEPYEE